MNGINRRCTLAPWTQICPEKYGSTEIWQCSVLHTILTWQCISIHQILKHGRSSLLSCPRPRVCPRPNSNQSCVRLLHPASSAPRPSRGCASPCAAQNHPAQPPSLSTHNKELGWILSLFSLASPLHNEPHHGGRLPCRPAHLRLYPHRQNGLASSH